MNIPFKIYYSNCTQQYNNCLYPNEIYITDIESLKKAVSHDYVCAKYKDNYRSIDNFISSNCVGVDFDNDHSNNPDDWVTSDSIKEMFSGVPYLVHYSKSHMKSKIGKGKTEYGPLPRFHVIFLIDEITNANEYKGLTFETKNALNANQSVYQLFKFLLINCKNFSLVACNDISK